jgi:hypothetical protein
VLNVGDNLGIVRQHSFLFLILDFLRGNLGEQVEHSINNSESTTDLNSVERFSSYRAVNAFFLNYSTQTVLAYRKIIAVCFEIHIKHEHTIYVQNVEL